MKHEFGHLAKRLGLSTTTTKPAKKKPKHKPAEHKPAHKPAKPKPKKKAHK